MDSFPPASSDRRPGPVLVGYEPTDPSRDALALGVVLARALAKPLLVACVYPREPALDLGSGDHGPTGRSEAETAVALGVSELPDDLPAGVEAVAVPSTPPAPGPPSEASPGPARGLKPAATLARLAEESSAEVLVIGSSRRGRLGRILPGGVGSRLLHGAGCPVAVAARGLGGGEPSLATVGTGFDGRPESHAALSWATRIARSTRAGLRLISVLEPLEWVHASLSPGYLVSWLDEGRRATRERQAEAIEHLPDDVVAEGVVREGSAADVLVAESERGLDLLVTGSRGYGPLGRILLGGVSARVVRDASCSVLVVPRPDEAAADAAYETSSTSSTGRLGEGSSGSSS